MLGRFQSKLDSLQVDDWDLIIFYSVTNIYQSPSTQLYGKYCEIYTTHRDVQGKIYYSINKTVEKIVYI
jgi:hypothetical protein